MTIRDDRITAGLADLRVRKTMDTTVHDKMREDVSIEYNMSEDCSII